MNNINDNNFIKLENNLKYDLKEKCNQNIEKEREYFKNKSYSSLKIDDETMHYFIICNFIRCYYVSKMGNPTINDVHTNITLYACLKKKNFSFVEEFMEINVSIFNFLIERYIANINNYSVDINTLDETRALLWDYHEYFIRKNNNNKSLKKEKNNK